mmetsp:Transcript_4861/g.8848  ORF Transcript_4861/g.8848 Transcript_4861/m.8848 type:complete len:215 (+) Transcript_4861:124-768(+)
MLRRHLRVLQVVPLLALQVRPVGPGLLLRVLQPQGLGPVLDVGNPHLVRPPQIGIAVEGFDALPPLHALPLGQCMTQVDLLVLELQLLLCKADASHPLPKQLMDEPPGECLLPLHECKVCLPHHHRPCLHLLVCQMGLTLHPLQLPYPMVLLPGPVAPSEPLRRVHKIQPAPQLLHLMLPPLILLHLQDPHQPEGRPHVCKHRPVLTGHGRPCL